MFGADAICSLSMRMPGMGVFCMFMTISGTGALWLCMCRMLMFGVSMFGVVFLFSIALCAHMIFFHMVMLSSCAPAGG